MTKTVAERTLTVEQAIQKGFRFVGCFPQANQPINLHRAFIAKGCEVADLAFGENGERVKPDTYALWVNPCAIAQCGCVQHAEEGLPCEHDLAELPRIVKEVLGVYVEVLRRREDEQSMGMDF